MKIKKVYRKVKRTWITKSGKVRHRTYKYQVGLVSRVKVKGRYKKTRYIHKAGKLVVRNGKLTKYGKEWVKEYSKNLDITERNDLEDLIWNVEDKITERTLVAKLKNTKLERFFYNIGIDASELAGELGVDEEDIMNEENWNFSEDTFNLGEDSWRVKFDYKKGVGVVSVN